MLATSPTTFAIKPILVDLVDRETVFLQWGLALPDGYPADDWQVSIRTAFAEEGPWQWIAKGLPTTVYTLRHHQARRNRWQVPFYVFELSHTQRDDLLFQSAPEYPSHPPDARAMGIRTKLENYLRAEHGVRITFLKKRTEGPTDQEAFDDLLHRPTGAAGDSYGYAYTGGFYDPIETWAKIGHDPRVISRQGPVPQGVSQTECWVAGMPQVTPGDVIVEWHVNRRWRVGMPVHRFGRRQTLFRQVFPVEEIAIGDPEYDVEVPRLHVTARERDSYHALGVHTAGDG